MWELFAGSVKQALLCARKLKKNFDEIKYLLYLLPERTSLRCIILTIMNPNFIFHVTHKLLADLPLPLEEKLDQLKRVIRIISVKVSHRSRTHV